MANWEGVGLGEREKLIELAISLIAVTSGVYSEKASVTGGIAYHYFLQRLANRAILKRVSREGW